MTYVSTMSVISKFARRINIGKVANIFTGKLMQVANLRVIGDSWDMFLVHTISHKDEALKRWADVCVQRFGP